jgi:hypothetical protein
MSRATLILIAALWCGAGSASDWQIPYDELRGASEKYLYSHTTAQERDTMAKRLLERVRTRMEDQGVDQDRAMRDIMLDWVAGNSNRLEEKEPAALRLACFYFMRFIDNGFQMPAQIRNRMTPENTRELIAFLRGEPAKNKVELPY